MVVKSGSKWALTKRGALGGEGGVSRCHASSARQQGALGRTCQTSRSPVGTRRWAHGVDRGSEPLLAALSVSRVGADSEALDGAVQLQRQDSRLATPPRRSC